MNTPTTERIKAAAKQGFANRLIDYRNLQSTEADAGVKKASLSLTADAIERRTEAYGQQIQKRHDNVVAVDGALS